MSVGTRIGWTHHTFNPWWGCAHVSPGCNNCYAEAFAKRVGWGVWGKDEERRFFSTKHWDDPKKWNASAEAAGVQRLVFCASMADVFEDRRDLDEQRSRLWGVIESTPSLVWQLLTKRPENIMRLAPNRWMNGFPANVWVGTTCERREEMLKRAPHLRDVPARMRFFSCEPLVGDLGEMDLDGIGWCIFGGESGDKRREMDLQWLYRGLSQCVARGVPVFVKQDSHRYPGQQGRIDDLAWEAKAHPTGWNLDTKKTPVQALAVLADSVDETNDERDLHAEQLAMFERGGQ